MDVIKFVPLQGCFDASFWAELVAEKLDKYKLSEAPIPLLGSLFSSRFQVVPSQLELDSLSFSQQSKKGAHELPGSILNVNTLEKFKNYDIQDLLKQMSSGIWRSIRSGEAEKNPPLLATFFVLAYADLKHYRFHYWLCMPALKPPQPFTKASSRVLHAAVGGEAASKIATACDGWRFPPTEGTAVCSSSTNSNPQATTPALCWLITASDAGFSTEVEAVPLSEGPSMLQAGKSVMVAFSDPSHMPENPGWPLRNILLLVAARWGWSSAKVLCVRDSRGRCDSSRSMVMDINLCRIPEAWMTDEQFVPDAVGWGHNSEGKTAPSFVDLSPMMDPVQLAEQAVGLNLKLMRWRAAPALELERISRCSCLLMGAGTLGCAVARTLLGWGVTHITFIDNSRVSFSNPARQSLYTHEHCLNGGAPKASAAAASLAAIHPCVQATGHMLDIPSPGHPALGPAEQEKMEKALHHLDSLVASHDVIFLLTDSRESRWLPTLLAAAHNKLAITAALGFDTFVVMRHGSAPDCPTPGTALGSSPNATDPLHPISAPSNILNPPISPGAAPDGVQPPLAAIGATEPLPVTSAHSNTLIDPILPPPGDRETVEVSSSSDPETRKVGEWTGGMEPEQSRLGCYFCNDVVAPANSMAGRSLDQQCTVARPGLAGIAGALAAELAAAALMYDPPCSAPTPSQVDQAPGPLGAPPHMIRGSLENFSQAVMEGRSFSQCTACSAAVVSRYRQDGWAFVHDVLHRPGALEEVTGLTELYRLAEDMDDTFGQEDDELGDAIDEEPREDIRAEDPSLQSAGMVAEKDPRLDVEDWTTL